jgi:hypothetical protein
METELKTYAEWNALGFRINKGAKAEGFKDGKPLFSSKSVYNYRKNGEEMREAEFRRQRLSARLGITGEWDDPPH